MVIGPDGFRMSHLAGCVERASTYMLTERDARELINHQGDVIEREWQDVCDLARMTTVDRSFYWHRQFLNACAFEGCSAVPGQRRDFPTCLPAHARQVNVRSRLGCLPSRVPGF
jgi:hypothetical protein